MPKFQTWVVLIMEKLVAFGGVEPIEHAKGNYLPAKDLLRLCVFGKGSVDMDHMYDTMLYPTVGK